MTISFLLHAAVALVPLLSTTTTTAADLPPPPPSPKVYRDRVEPHWFDADSRFWYRNDLAQGAREFVLVDAGKGTRQPAFDHARVAAALARLTGHAIEAPHLPIETLEFLTNSPAVILRGASDGEDRTWRLTLDSYELTAHQVDGRPAERAPKDDRDGDRGSGEMPTELRSPDGTQAAFVRDHNLWIRTATTGAETPLSFDGNPGLSFRKDVQRARLMGMEYEIPDPPASLPEAFWSPNSRYLVALQTRTVPERRVQLIESSPRDQLQPRLSSYPYLKAGDEIPVPTPRLFDVVTDRELGFPRELFPNPWSLDELRWAPDSSRFTFLYNQRGHQVMRVLAVTPPATDTPPGTPASLTPLVDENCPTFFDYSNKTYLEFLDTSGELVWMSERSGWNHLYLVDAHSGAVKNPITQGNWVVRGVDKIDATARQIWFRACGIRPGQDPYHVHLARVNLDGTGLVVLTEGDGTHEVKWSPDRRFFVDTWSRADLPPVTDLRQANDGTRVCLLEEADAQETARARGRFPERFVAMGRDGITAIWGLVHRPRDFDPAKRYPVLENIYAGPGVVFE